MSNIWKLKSFDCTKLMLIIHGRIGNKSEIQGLCWCLIMAGDKGMQSREVVLLFLNVRGENGGIDCCHI